MAVLNQTPFQLPDFAKMAYEKSLVDEESSAEKKKEKSKKRPKGGKKLCSHKPNLRI